jgi:hypothetical protein
MTTEENPPSLEKAFQLVGEFLYRFAQVEKAIDDGVGKLLGIESHP